MPLMLVELLLQKGRVLVLVGLALFFLQPAKIQAQSTAFSYQGRLNLNGSGASGNYDFTFGLYTTNSGGSAQSVATNLNVSVTSGLFLVTLDFGNLIAGPSYWLEIGVRSNAVNTNFTILAPRQNLTPAPFAIYALRGAITTNVFIGDGAGLTNLSVSNIVGLAAVTSGLTNSPVLNNATANGNLSIVGNLFLNPATNGVASEIILPPGGQVIWQPNGGTIFYNQNHSVEPELQFAGGGSASFTFGEDGLGLADVHFGGSGHYHTLWRMQYDDPGNGVSSASPLGKSTPFGFSYNVWNNGIEVGHLGSFWYEATGTNAGQNRLNWYDSFKPAADFHQVQLDTIHHLAGGFSPNTMFWGGAELTNAVVHGLSTVTTGTNYSIDFNPIKPDFIELDLLTNLALGITNLSLTNQAQKKDLIIRSAFSNWSVTFPSNWVWESESGSVAPPTAVSAGKFLHLTLLAEVNGSTNIYARATMGAFISNIDADASNFFAAASLTSQSQEVAVNQLCLSLKQHGLWTKLVALYPFVGDTGNGMANRLDLKGVHNLTWHGTIIHDANGITGDGVTGYGDTGIVPANVFASATNGMVFVWIKGPATPTVSGWFIGSADYSPAVYFGLSSDGFHLVFDGLNVLSAADTFPVSGASGFIGFAAANRTGDNAQDCYVNSTFSGTFAGPASVGLGTIEPLSILARNGDGSIDHFSNANLSASGLGQNFTQADMTQLMSDLSTYENTLGR